MVKYHHLTREQRYAITQLPKEGQSFRSIARTIEVSASTISREGLGVTRRIKFTLIIERKSGRKVSRKFTPSMHREAEVLLVEQRRWPEQISGRLRRSGRPMIGKTTLYKWLHEDKWQGGKLYTYCRHGLCYRKRSLATPMPII